MGRSEILSARSRRPAWRSVRTLAVASLSVLAWIGGTANRSLADTEEIGKALYLQYCGACHGQNAKGDGPAAESMKTKPTDLTQMAKKSGGSFSNIKAMQVIDGTVNIRAHGDSKMPVWGEVFRDEATYPLNKRAEVQGKVMLLTDYLRSIQEK